MTRQPPDEHAAADVRRRGIILRFQGWPIAVILCAAAFVRLYRIDLTWYFLDQVRDVSTALRIVSGQEFPLLGPLIGWTSGHLGPLYFYLVSPPFLITQNPIAGIVFVALVNVVTVLICYSFVSKYFGAAAAIVSSALFAVFPLGVFSSRVLWNPAFVPLFSLLFMQALFALIVRGQSRAFVWMCACLAVLTQLHLTTAALGVLGAFALVVWRPRIRLLHVTLGLGVFTLLYLPYLWYELHHQFENTRAIVRGLGASQPGAAPPALISLLRSLAVLYRPAIDGFLVVDPWPHVPFTIFSLLYRAEGLLFCAGMILGVWWLVRDRKEAVPSATRTRRALCLLLLWVLLPVVLLGTRRTSLWWYYLDLLYPSPFIFASLALCSISSLGSSRSWTGRLLVGLAASFVVAVMVSQIWFQIGLQNRIDRQGQLLFDVPKLSVASPVVALATLPSLPYGYRTRLLESLVTGFNLSPDAFARRVHGSVLGRPDENQHLLQYIARGRGGAQDAGTALPSHYLVTPATNLTATTDTVRSKRIGAYVVAEYRPRVDYDSWRCTVEQQDDPTTRPIGRWRQLALPANDVAMTLSGNTAFVCEGAVHVPENLDSMRLVVALVADAPLRLVGAETPYGRVAPATERSWQSPSLYWTSEAAFDLRGLRAGECHVRFEATGRGHILGVDVYE